MYLFICVPRLGGLTGLFVLLPIRFLTLCGTVRNLMAPTTPPQAHQARAASLTKQLAGQFYPPGTKIPITVGLETCKPYLGITQGHSEIQTRRTGDRIGFANDFPDHGNADLVHLVQGEDAAGMTGLDEPSYFLRFSVSYHRTRERVCQHLVELVV